MTNERTAWGWGLASIDAAGNTLDVWYPQLTLGAVPEGANRPNHEFGALAQPQADARGVRREPVFTVSSLDDPIADAADAYLRLHLLPWSSHFLDELAEALEKGLITQAQMSACLRQLNNLITIIYRDKFDRLQNPLDRSGL